MQQSTEQTSIDEFIARILSTTQDWIQIVPELNALTQQQLLSFTSDSLDPLTILDPSLQSLAYLYFITARCFNSTKEEALRYFQLLSRFVQVFDVEQVVLSPTCFRLVGSACLHLAQLVQQPLLPLEVLLSAIQRYSGSPLILTSLHSTFVKACILAKMYTYPLQLLDYDIEIIDTTKNDLDIQSVLEYYFYGSMVYIANKNFVRALDFLSIVISAPTQKLLSAIQIAAYKKYVLVCLIGEGQMRPLPKYTASTVEKVCKSQAVVYLQLADAFKDTNIRMFQDIASRSSNIFENDKHIGLIKQCFQSLLRKKIKELTKVYITVGLNEMAKKIENVSPKELELILIEMINQKQISASISITEQLTKMVHFNDDEEEEEKQSKLEKSILNLSTINSRISYMDKLEGLNRDFQTKYMTLSSTGPGGISEHFVDEEMELPVDEEAKSSFAV
ncbi:hypothetical protein G6F37_008355 [Rhizopus arrhizus]|nr:hypothetical protein G6F37_008355 [Rhizopus arrhizus]